MKLNQQFLSSSFGLERAEFEPGISEGEEINESKRKMILEESGFEPPSF